MGKSSDSKQLISEMNEKEHKTIIQNLISKNDCESSPKSKQSNNLKTQNNANDEEYIYLMQSGDKKARDKLIENNMRLIMHVCKKYRDTAETEDLISTGLIGLIKGIDSFKIDKGCQLSTYLCRCIENEILMSLRKKKNSKVCVSLEDSVPIDKYGDEMLIKDLIPQDSELEPPYIVENKVIVEDYLKYLKRNLSQKEYTIILLRFGFCDGVYYTQKEVAKKLHISASYVSFTEIKALNMLRNKFNTKKDYIEKNNN